MEIEKCICISIFTLHLYCIKALVWKMHDLFLNENGIENCIEPLSMKMLNVLFSFNAQVPSDRHRSKTQDRGAKSHREGITEYAPSYALLHFFRTLTFCKIV